MFFLKYPLHKSNQELFKNIPNHLDEKVKARLQTLKKKTL